LAVAWAQWAWRDRVRRICEDRNLAKKLRRDAREKS
jgi:hypothetical protein